MKLDKLYMEAVKFKTLKEAYDETPKLYDSVDGFYAGTNPTDGYPELLDFVGSIMKRFNVGRLLKVRKWGARRVGQITNLLRQNLEQDVESGQIMQSRRNALDVYDDLRKKIKDDKFSKYDFARVARTETVRMKVIAQLLMWKDLGLEKVEYRTRNDSKVGEDHKKLQRKIYRIDYLLSPAGEKERIPNRPNCRCRYEAVLQ